MKAGPPCCVGSVLNEQMGAGLPAQEAWVRVSVGHPRAGAKERTVRRGCEK